MIAGGDQIDQTGEKADVGEAEDRRDVSGGDVAPAEGDDLVEQ